MIPSIPARACAPQFGKVSKTQPTHHHFKPFELDGQKYYVTQSPQDTQDWKDVMQAYTNRGLALVVKSKAQQETLSQAAEATFARLAAKADRILTLKRAVQPEKALEVLA